MGAGLAAASGLVVGFIPNGQQAWTYGYGERMIGMITSPLALLAGIIVTQIAAVVARRLTRPITPAPARA
jgi:hypothetical protein